jgi:hypothetical protein
MRIVHFFVICFLVFAAAYVYRIKMESTVRTERVMKLRQDIRTEREAIASLHANWARLESPPRLQGLAERHTKLRFIEATQYDNLKNLPERPPSFIKPNDPDPIATMIEANDPDLTSSVTPQEDAPQAEASQ